MSAAGTTELLPCPFCGQALARKTGRVNPMARCITEGCIVAAKMPVINLYDPIDVAAWNTRALPVPDATEGRENDRLKRCISMAMGCLDPLAKRPDEALAWYRLLDAIEGREPRPSLALPSTPSNTEAG